MELVGPSKRKMAGVVMSIFFACGEVLLGIVAYFLRDYQHLQLAIATPYLLFISYIWLIPESPRWLVARSRWTEADAVLQRAARCNGVSLPADWQEEVLIEAEHEKQASSWGQNLRVMFRTPTLRIRMLILYFCWPVVSAIYYGLSMNPTFIGGHRYLTFIASAFMEIPGIVFAYFALDRWGRKPLISGGYFFCALCLFSTLLIPPHITWLKAAQVVLSKMAITTTYAVLYTFSPELVPTAVRASALGSCSMMARIGAVSASYISMWLVYKSRLAMVLLFGGFALTAGILSLYLPETAGRPLPESVEDLHKSHIQCCPRRCRSNDVTAAE